nr:hypothetical protein [Tanacetum cinerariifolium]
RLSQQVATLQQQVSGEEKLKAALEEFKRQQDERVEQRYAIAANISRAEKKKRCRIVCRTHGVGSAHHARSDGVSVSAPTVVP